MSVFRILEEHIKRAVEAMDLPHEALALVSRITAEPPRDTSHGDVATNAAMVLAKAAGKNPREIASDLVTRLAGLQDVETAEIAGPGFVNLKLSKAFWYQQLEQMLQQGADYGRGLLSDGEKVNVEYVSANPTGPMHVGHCRGAVVGDALANLLSFAGYEVTKEYYINDAGGQIDVLADSLFHRYRQALGEDVGPIPDGMYPGDYLVAPAQVLAEQYADQLVDMNEAERSDILKSHAIAAMMEMIRNDLAALNIYHDFFFSEKSLHEASGNGSKIDLMLDALRDSGLVFEGTLPPPKGEVPDDWEDREQTLFRATSFGDDTDRALIKSDGSYTYFAADVAYFKDKYERGFKRMVFVLGADHSGYSKRLKAVANAIAGENAKLDVIFCQLVKLMRDGEPVAMGKRSGNFVTLRDVVDEVGRDAVRFMMLYRKAEAPLDFDFAKVTEQSKDNPVFYVQYAHARVCSVFRQMSEELPEVECVDAALANADFTQLVDAGELALVKKAAEFPRIIEQAVRSDEPHRLAFYLYELASELHTHWSRGKEMPELRIINQKNAQLTLSRLALLRGIASVLVSGLTILGVEAPQEMR